MSVLPRAAGRAWLRHRGRTGAAGSRLPVRVGSVGGVVRHARELVPAAEPRCGGAGRMRTPTAPGSPGPVRPSCARSSSPKATRGTSCSGPDAPDCRCLYPRVSLGRRPRSVPTACVVSRVGRGRRPRGGAAGRDVSTGSFGPTREHPATRPTFAPGRPAVRSRAESGHGFTRFGVPLLRHRPLRRFPRARATRPADSAGSRGPAATGGASNAIDRAAGPVEWVYPRTCDLGVASRPGGARSIRLVPSAAREVADSGRARLPAVTAGPEHPALHREVTPVVGGSAAPGHPPSDRPSPATRSCCPGIREASATPRPTRRRDRRGTRR